MAVGSETRKKVAAKSRKASGESTKKRQPAGQSSKPMDVNCYDYPRYWDFAFSGETSREADFLEEVGKKYAKIPVQRVFEPGCGGGRLVVEMARRGYDVTALDLSEKAIDYVGKLLKRRKLGGELLVGDMTDFELSEPIDLAFNTVNTFRHLTSEQDAQSHLKAIAKNLRVGGLYILGLHLLPPDADLDQGERWTTEKGKTRVTVTLRVLEASRRTRLETLRFCLRVRDGEKDLRLRSDYTLRMYSAAQIKRTLEAVPEFEICQICDFWYDLEDSFKLDDEMGDTVFVLRRVR